MLCVCVCVCVWMLLVLLLVSCRLPPSNLAPRHSSTGRITELHDSEDAQNMSGPAHSLGDTRVKSENAPKAPVLAKILD